MLETLGYNLLRNDRTNSFDPTSPFLYSYTLISPFFLSLFHAWHSSQLSLNTSEASLTDNCVVTSVPETGTRVGVDQNQISFLFEIFYSYIRFFGVGLPVH